MDNWQDDIELALAQRAPAARVERRGDDLLVHAYGHTLLATVEDCHRTSASRLAALLVQHVDALRDSASRRFNRH